MAEREQLGQAQARAAQVALVAAAQQVADQQPLGRCGRGVAEQVGQRTLERRGDLLQDQDRSVAAAGFQIGQVPLGDVRRGSERLARQAAPRAQRADALAERDQQGRARLAVRFRGRVNYVA